MPQVRKDEVLERITSGAVRTFAAMGYEGATMGEIAKASSVSTGNLYRYFASKEELFDAVLPDAFVETFRALVRSRVKALSRGVVDVLALPPIDPYTQAVDELLRFSIENRLRVVILLGRAQGSKHAGVAEETVSELVELAAAFFRERGEEGVLPPARRFVLVRIYRHLVAMNVAILAEHDDEKTIRECAASFNAYHLTGLRAFFAPKREP